MNIVADPRYATTIVFDFINNLNRHLSYTKNVDADRFGSKNQTAREKAQAKAMKGWHASADKALKDTPRSRQVIRRMARQQRKSMTHSAKVQAMRDQIAGGAAAVQ